ncbi:MAG: FAD-dependent oxidoreductase [Leptospiraceae bacterium]|nr:FAD-dependent oxidoreductase [Leptospiraceae bacterium]MDW8305802.1 FAD-dependent oxidoreductase [Leptospiraceae bacterium]
MKPSLAIVGSGISGLGCAYYLKDKYNIKIYEKEDYAGGHSNTVDVREKEKTLPIDTGFIVFNKITYPLLVQLFEELGVSYQESDMSFSFYHEDSQLQYHGSSLNGLFAQRINLLRPAYYRFLLEIHRFNQQAPKHLPELSPEITLGDYLKRERYSSDFIEYFLIPMGSAVWSTPAELMFSFPASTLIRFFHNHGFLGLNTQYQWYTIQGGSREYVRLLREAIAKKQGRDVFLKTPVRHIESDGKKIKLYIKNKSELFDKVILACHAPDALKIIKKPSPLQQELLSAFRYHKNLAVLHHDESVMPPLKRIWCSWNYRRKGNLTSTVYYMNRLQKLKTQINYFVSINDYRKISPAKIIKTIEYEHPLFDSKAILYQNRLHELNKKGPIFFCGAYFRYGFHEDGLWSAKVLSERLL